MKLSELQIGKSGVIKDVGGSGALRQHFLDMGMIPGAEVTVVKLAPMGDPMELQVHGYELTLRLAEAAQIEIDSIEKRSNPHARVENGKESEHPGLRMEGTIRRRMRTRFRRERSLLMPWWVIRIAEKLHFSTSLPVLTSMLATSRVSPSTGRMALLKGILTLTLRIYPEYIRCRHTAVRRLYRVTLCSMNTQRQSST